MQAGIGVSKLFFIIGAGYTGSILLRNGKLSDLLADLQTLVKKSEEPGEQSAGDDALASQVRRLAMEVRQLASSRSITVLNGDSGQSGSMTSLIVPAATLGALGYGYMWWKGFSFSDLMYVTKENMANAVTSMKKHLDHVTAELAAAKRHLTQRMDNMDGKLDEQKEISKEINKGVIDARGQLSNIGNDLNYIQNAAWRLNGMVDTIEDKQNFGNMGVMYLCQYVLGKGGKMPDFLQDVPKMRGYLGSTETRSLKGLQHITQTIKSGNFDKAKTEALHAELEILNNSKGLSRPPSIEC
ncbi:uncharacterized protein M6B38_158910 [Iris pallida]|uniref:DUF1664 domain-containing protein n=1 Tax=Iris pallida TaxID=29817 RepID=A0AAX6DV47_IRIPA|nr:Uncharacterized protein M6B38_225885 [Iris pallida]KAJ6810328.1 uncharacterized protein M6B38_158910 [Iris pallida]